MSKNKQQSRGQSGLKNIERPGLTEDEIEEIREAFNLFDAEQSGYIDPKDLKTALQNIGYEQKNPTIYQLITKLEEEGKKIDFQEFLDVITSKLGDKETRNGINKIFKFFDTDNTGSINLNNFKRVAKDLGESLSLEELQDILERASSNGKEITFDDFYNIMTKKSF